MIYYDSRWRGAHGIGRFSSAVSERIVSQPLKITGNPASPIDPFKVSLALCNLPRDAVFFSPGFNAPVWSRHRFIFTVHDLNHVDRSENTSVSKRLYYATLLKNACRRAARVLTVSDFSRARIAEWSGLPLDHITNVSNGVEPAFNPDVTPYAPGYPYLFCVGNRKLHKNEPRVLEAFAAAATSSDIKLVLTGNSNLELAALIQNLGIGRRVVFAGQIPENRLPSFYRGAIALVFPSLYEGFGLPVIEAMACGTPVITSNTTALPEVAGDAALLVNPESIAEITTAILRLTTNGKLNEELRPQKSTKCYVGSDPAKYRVFTRVL